MAETNFKEGMKYHKLNYIGLDNKLHFQKNALNLPINRLPLESCMYCENLKMSLDENSKDYLLPYCHNEKGELRIYFRDDCPDWID